MTAKAFLGTAFFLAILGVGAAAQTLAPDRVRNIEKAAAEIGAIQKKSGANGAFAAIQDCYTRELAQATALTPGLDACMAEDIIASYVTAEVYSRHPTPGRDPDAVINAMTDRVVAIIRRFHMPPEDAHAFIDIAKTEGIRAFARAAQSLDQFPTKKN
jgi:hypothetical protein